MYVSISLNLVILSSVPARQMVNGLLQLRLAQVRQTKTIVPTLTIYRTANEYVLNCSKDNEFAVNFVQGKYVHFLLFLMYPMVAP